MSEERQGWEEVRSSTVDEVPFWERANIRARELAALQIRVHAAERELAELAQVAEAGERAVECLYASYMQFMPLASHEQEMDMMMELVGGFRKLIAQYRAGKGEE